MATEGTEKVKRYRNRRKELLLNAFGNKCQICGYDRCVKALEFHHLDPSKKELELGRSITSWKKTKEEMKKWQNSPKGQLIQKQPIQNVGQLIELLKTLPSDAPIVGGDRYREFEYACDVYLIRDYNKFYVGFLSKNW